MRILLGVFHTPYWSAIKTRYKLLDYPFNSRYFSDGYLGIVICACEKADDIYFNLDGVYLPLDKKYHSGEELQFLLKWDHLLEKTKFLYKGDVIDHDVVMTILLSKKSGLFGSIYEEETENIPVRLYKRIFGK